MGENQPNINNLYLFKNVNAGKVMSKMQCGGEVEHLMMENLAVDMMDISF